MPQTLTIYVGTDKVNKRRRAALNREAKRRGRGVSVSDIIWEALTKGSSAELRADLEAAERERA